MLDDLLLAIMIAVWAAEPVPVGRMGMWLGPDAYVGV
jgi:hypothetical protein